MAHLKNLTQLKAAGGVVSREPIKKPVTWKHLSEDGQEMEDTFDVWILRSNIGLALSIYKEAEKVDREGMLIVLSKLVMLENDKGKQVLIAYEEWDAFDTDLCMAIYKVVQEVRNPPKNSQQPTNSCANSSPAESAVAPSKKLENA
jgi:hypothetical protein